MLILDLFFHINTWYSPGAPHWGNRVDLTESEKVLRFTIAADMDRETLTDHLDSIVAPDN